MTINSQALENRVNAAFHNRHPSLCQVFIAPNTAGTSPAKLDSFVARQGLIPTQGRWSAVSRPQARSLLIDLMRHSLFYASEIMTESAAVHLADQFLRAFDTDESRYYTNLILDHYPPVLRLRDLPGLQAAPLQLDFLLSIAVVAADPYQIGVFVRGEND